MSSIGFSKQNAEYETSIVEKEVKKHFKPEFINRIDNIIHFNILSREAIMTLLDMELAKLKKQVKKHDVELIIPNEVKEFLLDENYSIEYGFRPFKRKINDEIKLIVAEALLEDKPKEIKITIVDEKIKAVF
jgi:ATP-dependent Clp protease ATP-binding subunit ClpA